MRTIDATRVNRRTAVGGFAASLVVGAGVLKASSVAGAQDLSQAPATPIPAGDAIPPEIAETAGNWPTAQGNLKATRVAEGSAISSETIDTLGVAWRAEVSQSGLWGSLTTNPIAVGETVYVQDMRSNVYAYDKSTGELKWQRDYDIGTNGPNGVGVGYGNVYAPIGDTAEVVALDAETGDEIWRVKLSNHDLQGVNVAPLVYDSLVYVSTNPGDSTEYYVGGIRGTIYALDATTGSTVWLFDTTTENLWGNARENSGGGLWYPPSVDDNGVLYAGIGNPGPWPGTAESPNGSSRPGENLYSSSMIALDPATAGVRWHVQAQPHDLFDWDFQNTPILTTIEIDGEDTLIAIGSGKTGTAIAANAETGEELWNVPFGFHLNSDLTEIPEEGIDVAPGAGGGSQIPAALSDGLFIVPTSNGPTRFTPSSFGAPEGDYSDVPAGQLVALDVTSGETVWDIPMPTGPYAGVTIANDLAFTAGLDGVVRAYAVATGELVWTFQAAAGINSPFAIAGDYLFIAAGTGLSQSPDAWYPLPEQKLEVIALKLGGEVQVVPEGTVIGAPDATPVAAVGDGEQTSVTVHAVDIAYTESDITLPADTEVTIELINEGMLQHDLVIDELGVKSELLDQGDTQTLTFSGAAGTYEYYCSVSGHKAAGMVGTLTLV